MLLRDHADGVYWFEGHTDSDQISKSKFDSNRHLAAERAMSVLKYMVEDAGVPDAACVLVSHGEYLPIADNGTEEGRDANRRIEFHLIRNEPAAQPETTLENAEQTAEEELQPETDQPVDPADAAKDGGSNDE